jgi:hypothetical protein
VVKGSTAMVQLETVGRIQPHPEKLRSTAAVELEIVGRRQNCSTPVMPEVHSQLNLAA